ncbi:embigin-like [Heptranchias perlo]|uniref:embigin-like n=1 Tax=Heptranchias perlo TaxID=212740 RepID=UPI00355AC04E
MTGPLVKRTLSAIFLIISFRDQVESDHSHDTTSPPRISMHDGNHLPVVETIHLSGDTGSYGVLKSQAMDPTIVIIDDNEPKVLNIPWPSETIPSDNRMPLLVEQKITANQQKEQPPPGTNSVGRSSGLTLMKVNITKATKIVLSCNLTLLAAQKPPITGTWEKDGNEIDRQAIDFDQKAGYLSQKYEFDFQNGSDAGNYSCVFDTNPKSEGKFEVQIPPIWSKNEEEIRSDGDHVNLTCKSGQYIPLYWIWSKEVNGNKVTLSNETDDQFYIRSNGNKSSLLIKSLIMDNTTYYHCDAVYEVGSSGLRIYLKVNSLVAAIIPFLCIVAEVLVLVIFILACERKMKQKEDPADELFPEKLTAEELLDSNENGARHRKV